MAMATRCPGCETVFRVTPQQLQAHQGQVRCGRCMNVFDGFRSLATLPDAAAEPPAAPAGDEPAAPVAEPAPLPAPGETEAVAAPAADVPEFGLEAVDEPPVPAPEPPATDATPYPAMTRAPAIALEPYDEDPDPEPPRRTWPWAVGAFFVLLALAGQAAYFYRSELAAQYPVIKPALVELCQFAGCRVPLPQRPKLINIEASDLQVLDPARPGAIQLTATLRNHAAHDVGFPALDLVLTNTREHTLARRIFLPAEYLGPGRDPAAGIPAKGEVTVRVDLDTGDLGAAGFRLELLPAPAPAR